MTRVRFAGFGGQGVVLSGFILGRAACLHAGKNAAMTQNYGPESRGGACAADVVVEDKEITMPVFDQPDVLVILSQEAANKNSKWIAGAKLVLIDEDLVHLEGDDPRVRKAPFTRMATALGRRIVANIVMLGTLTARSGLVPPEAMEEAIRSTVPPKTIELNLKAFRAGLAVPEAAA
ncbi:MAG TPA: 2-oxoacid:acceptor oxidoreductase family protein [Thermoplasmata archaeon]|nr:2-oxoacid:acceptor oxidoreductase family protein [Thermoplasmata archaeon]